MACRRVTGEILNPGLGVVVVAAGDSHRMAGVDKIFAPILGLPLIAHTLGPLEASPIVSEMVLVLSDANVEMGKAVVREHGWSKVTSVCRGGARRQDSVRLGLERLSPWRWVAVHDGARPCIDSGLLQRGVDAARETGMAVAAVPAKDTVKVVSSAGIVEATPPRDSLWMVQTPQVCGYDLLLHAHRTCLETFTDDAAMVESLGHEVKVFMGSYSNIKVTTPEDLAMVELILRGTLPQHHDSQPELRAPGEARWPSG